MGMKKQIQLKDLNTEIILDLLKQMQPAYDLFLNSFPKRIVDKKWDLLKEKKLINFYSRDRASITIAGREHLQKKAAKLQETECEKESAS